MKKTPRLPKRLPKGLMEFGGTLGDPEYSGIIMPRLLDLPESNFHDAVARHKAALVKVAEAEAALKAARRAAREIAESAFRQALAHWTIKEIQEATGYDNT